MRLSTSTLPHCPLQRRTYASDRAPPAPSPAPPPPPRPYKPPPPRPSKPPVAQERAAAAAPAATAATSSTPTSEPSLHRRIITRLFSTRDRTPPSSLSASPPPRDLARGLEASQRVVRDGVLDPRYRSAARKVGAIIIALPFVFFLGYELAMRRFAGKQVRRREYVGMEVDGGGRFARRLRDEMEREGGAGAAGSGQAG